MPRGQKIDAQAVLERVLREGPDALLSRGEAAALIAARVKDGVDSDRTARNRVGLQLDRSRARGNDVSRGGLACTEDGRYTADEIGRWANGAYEGMFNDLPCKPREFFARVHVGLGMRDAVSNERTPGNLQECQALVEVLRGQLRQAEVKRQHAEEERKRKLRENLRGK